MQPTNKQKINQAHDAYGKECLSRQEVAIDFLKGHLPKELVDMLDLDSLELTKGSFVDSLFQFHNDIAYKVKIKGKQSFIYFLVELQLNPEELMAFRLLCYLVLILKAYFKQNKQAKKLPLVFPICLYNGKAPYRFSTSIYDCFEDPATARAFKLLEQFMLLDLSTFSREELLKHGTSALFQTLYKESETGDFTDLVKSFSSEFLSSLDPSYIASSLLYLLNQSAANKGAQALNLLLELITNENIRREVMKYPDKLRQEGRQEGMKKGMQEGIKKGILETAKNLIKQGFSLESIAKATGLSKGELAQLA